MAHLLQEVKDKLKITWNDEDAALQKMIERGQAYLNDLTGAALDYDTEGQPKSLLLEYCRYDYNNALEYFEENFQGNIRRLQIMVGIEALTQEVVPDEG